MNDGITVLALGHCDGDQSVLWAIRRSSYRLTRTLIGLQLLLAADAAYGFIVLPIGRPPVNVKVYTRPISVQFNAIQ